jgi:hypothetical protein
VGRSVEVFRKAVQVFIFKTGVEFLNWLPYFFMLGLSWAEQLRFDVFWWMIVFKGKLAESF